MDKTFSTLNPESHCTYSVIRFLNAYAFKKRRISTLARRWFNVSTWLIKLANASDVGPTSAQRMRASWVGKTNGPEINVDVYRQNC